MTTHQSKELLAYIEQILKSSIQSVIKEYNGKGSFDQLVLRRVNAEMRKLNIRSFSHIALLRQLEVKRVDYEPALCGDGIITGNILIDYKNKPDYGRYGGNGYKGTEDGQLCEHPKGSRKFYKWDSRACRWRNVYHSIQRNTGQSMFDKLTQNAAFEPIWGSGTTRSNYITNDRKYRGNGKAWGSMDPAPPLGTFEQATGNIMQSVYRFSIDLRAGFDFLQKFYKALGLDKKKSATSTKKEEKQIVIPYARDENPNIKVKITLERIERWHMWRAYGKVNESGLYRRIDTFVFPIDSNNVKKINKNKNNEIIDKERTRFFNKEH